MQTLRFVELPLPVRCMLTSMFSYEDFCLLKKLVGASEFSWVDIAEYTYKRNFRKKRNTAAENEELAENECRYLSEYVSTCPTCKFTTDCDTSAVYYTRDYRCLLCQEKLARIVKFCCEKSCVDGDPIDGDLVNPTTDQPLSRDVVKCPKCGCVSFADAEDDNDRYEGSDVSDDDYDESEGEAICRVCDKAFEVCECSDEEICNTCNGPCSCERCPDCGAIMTIVDGYDGYVCKPCDEMPVSSDSEDESDEELDDFVVPDYVKEKSDKADIKERMRDNTQRSREKSDRKAEKRARRDEKREAKRRRTKYESESEHDSEEKE